MLSDVICTTMAEPESSGDDGKLTVAPRISRDVARIVKPDNL
jgi:hypothetical protein